MVVAPGTKSCNSSNAFGINSTSRTVTPVTFPPGRARLFTRPNSTGTEPRTNTIGIVDRCLGGKRRRRSAACDNHGHMDAYQFARQTEHQIVLTPCPAVLDSHIPPLDIA